MAKQTSVTTHTRKPKVKRPNVEQVEKERVYVKTENTALSVVRANYKTKG